MSSKCTNGIGNGMKEVSVSSVCMDERPTYQAHRFSGAAQPDLSPSR